MNHLSPKLTQRLQIFLIMIIPLMVVMCFSYLSINYQWDDPLIYMRYIKNFHDGLGLVYNPGEKFNGLTSPFFTYIILVMSSIFSTIQITTVVLSALFLWGASILGGALFSKSKMELIFCAVIIASFDYFYSTFGMETPLFLMLIGLSLYLYKINSLYFVISLAFLVITRSEGIFLAAVIGIDYLIRHKKLPDLRFMLVAAIIFVAPFIFNYFYYGDFLPHTGSAKIGQGQSGLWGESLIFLNAKYLIAFFSGSQVSLWFFIGFAIYGIYNLAKDRIALLSIVFCILLLGFYIGLNIPSYHWYYAPLFYFLLIFSSHGFWQLCVKLLSKGLLNFRAILFLLLCGMAIFSLEKTISFNIKGGIDHYVKAGEWIKNNTPTDASVAMIEIGTVGWYSDRKIIDILGLVNPYNADYLAQRDFDGWLQHYQPDYILRHEPIWPHETSIQILEKSGAYIPLSEFQVPGLILLKKSDKYSDEQIAHISHEQMMVERGDMINRYTPEDSQVVIFGAYNNIANYFQRKSYTVSFDSKQYNRIWENPVAIIENKKLGALIFCVDNNLNIEKIMTNNMVKQKPILFKMDNCYLWLPDIEYVETPVSCEGNIDSIKVIDSLSTQKTRDHYLSTFGWLVTSSKQGVVPDDILVTLTNQQQEKIYMTTHRVTRPDVSAHFNQLNLLDSGFQTNINISDLNGDYAVGLSRINNNKLEHCAQFNTPIHLGKLK